ncbi:FHA domain-containing protein [Longimicrobium sp.]|uniref:FHA domain-containing protein n=1 Tax=Longimicrobium sp. TaxID=2029185 RepID=UPI002D0864D8|nr:FHA domain-containing protein [Longimicrobium sp.]HSU17064.1 FHA domain-containing protein [Longimicrobium sp.]
MFNSLRKLLRPTLRQQLEDGVREALRRYADRRTAPDLRVYVSTDLVPEGMSAGIFARDEADHLRRFAAQWAQDNGIARAGIRVEIVLLDTKREFAFVKPLGLVEEPQAQPDQFFARAGGERALVPEPPRAAPAPAPFAQPQAPFAAPQQGGGGRGALLEVVSSEVWRDPVRVDGELTVGRKPEPGVFALGDRYMSGRHARFRSGGGRLFVTDLDSKNRTFVNEQPIAPNQELEMRPGDTVRMGNTVLRLSRFD